MAAWLSGEEPGLTYRLPTDAEWSAAVGGSTYPWGTQWPPPSNFGNYCGQEFKTQAAIDFVSSVGWKAGQLGVIGGFSDRHVFTAAVGSYPANGYGLHDLGGNVWEWCEDWHPDHRGKFRVLRGGSWCYGGNVILASSGRLIGIPDLRDYFSGFRVVVVR